MKRICFLLFGALAVAFVVLTLRPIASPTASNTTTVTGTLELCMQAANAEHDVVISLRDMQDRFYINRGTEHGVNPEGSNANWRACLLMWSTSTIGVRWIPSVQRTT